MTADAPKRRGRPPRNATSTTASSQPAKPATAPNKPTRGRPKKTETPAPMSTATSKRKRVEQEEPASVPQKKRGRPPKTEATISTKPANTMTSAKVGAPANPAGRRGRKPKITTENVLSETEEEDIVIDLKDPAEEEASDYQYWLMKAEPESRIEKGVDVAYPIDKLAEATEPEPWDGVRNAVARNNMRAMRKGDLAFFYHSNCAVPGIVGVMRIAEEHSVDESAFDPTHPYYDEKSDRSKPKWDCVKVEFIKKFANIITLKQLKSTPELADMQIAQAAYGRLSVQKVSPSQWKFVLKMANEPEDLGITSPLSGYEADTNGETDIDKEVVEESIGVNEENGGVSANDLETAAKPAAYGNLDDPDDEAPRSPLGANGDATARLNGDANAVLGSSWNDATRQETYSRLD